MHPTTKQPTIYVATMPGCPACADAKRHLPAFRRAHPGVSVVLFNVLEADWPDAIRGAAPDMTPTYWMVAGGKVKRKHAGWMTASELGAWAKG